MDYNLIINVMLIALILWFLYSRFAGVRGLNNLASEQFEAGLKGNHNKVLIDVREPNEVKQGYIPGAINIPLTQLNHRLSEISKDRSVYLYCRSGMRSKQAARILQKNGFRDLSHLQGGIMAWKGKVKK